MLTTISSKQLQSTRSRKVGITMLTRPRLRTHDSPCRCNHHQKTLGVRTLVSFSEYTLYAKIMSIATKSLRVSTTRGKNYVARLQSLWRCRFYHWEAWKEKEKRKFKMITWLAILLLTEASAWDPYLLRQALAQIGKQEVFVSSQPQQSHKSFPGPTSVHMSFSFACSKAWTKMQV